MGSPPDKRQVREVAAGIGFDLSEDEADVFTKRLEAQLASIDAFMRSSTPQVGPEHEVRRVDLGWQPSREENPYNAWLWRTEVQATAEGPLEGKSISLKDHIPLAGAPLTFGSPLMAGYIPDYDAPIVTRLLRAGGAIAGKANLDNFSIPGASFGGVGDTDAVINPHHRAMVTGGSSSGSAVLVATRESTLSIGGDQFGSVRVPAAWCGVIGLKPTTGAVPHTGVIGADQSLDVLGPMGLYTEDVSVCFDVLQGRDPLDPRQRGIDIGEHADLSKGIEGLTIGVLQEGFTDSTHEDVRTHIENAADVLSRAGAEIVRCSVPEHLDVIGAASVLGVEGGRALFDVGFGGAFTEGFYPQSLIRTFNAMVHGSMDEIPPNMKLRYIAAEFARRKYFHSAYAKAQNVRPYFREKYDSALSKVDALLMPTIGVPALERPSFKDGAERLDFTLYGSEEGLSTKLLANTIPFSFTGHPAISVPCGKVDGLPVGMQLVGSHFDEQALLRISYAFENGIDWESLIAIPDVPSGS